MGAIQGCEETVNLMELIESIQAVCCVIAAQRHPESNLHEKKN